VSADATDRAAHVWLLAWLMKWRLRAADAYARYRPETAVASAFPCKGG
jgi:hypothetical protein